MKAPLVTGISRRLIFGLVSLFISVLLLFFYFLYHYSTYTTVRPSRARKASLIDWEATVSSMQQIKKPVKQPIVLTGVRRVKNKVFRHVANDELSVGEFRRGSQSRIAVSKRSAWNSIRKGPVQKPTDSHLMHEDYTLKAGTLISSVLLTAINSDLPGVVMAKVTRNVFDTVTGQYLLLPQGSTVIGRYNSEVTLGQSRVLVNWSKLILPNGHVMELNNMPGVGMLGRAGLHDQVNHHWLRRFKEALALNLLRAASEMSQPNGLDYEQASRHILGRTLGQQISMHTQPTITIRAGTPFNILLVKELHCARPYL